MFSFEIESYSTIHTASPFSSFKAIPPSEAPQSKNAREKQRGKEVWLEHSWANACAVHQISIRAILTFFKQPSLQLLQCNENIKNIVILPKVYELQVFPISIIKVYFFWHEQIKHENKFLSVLWPTMSITLHDETLTYRLRKKRVHFQAPLFFLFLLLSTA